MFKKLLVFLGTVAMLIGGFASPVVGECQTIDLYLNGYRISTLYSEEGYDVRYFSEGNVDYAVVVDESTGERVDLFSVKVEPTTSTRSVQPRSITTFTNEKSEGAGIVWGTEIKAETTSSGSFGQIERISSYTNYIASGVSNMYKEDDSVAISPKSGSYPTWGLDVSASTTLVASVNSSVGATLVGVGFTHSGTTYYRKRCTNNFTVTYGY